MGHYAESVAPPCSDYTSFAKYCWFLVAGCTYSRCSWDNLEKDTNWNRLWSCRYIYIYTSIVSW